MGFTRSANCVTSATPLPAVQSVPLAFEAEAATGHRALDACGAPADLHLVLHDNLDEAEALWRRFEQVADCTPFQTFDWLHTWQRQIGAPAGVHPLIAVVSYPDGETALILPLAVERQHGALRLCWLGQDLNDYNAPLLARDFSSRVGAESFRSAWIELRAHAQRQPALRHDWIELEKMPQTIGGQLNPFFHLPLADNPSGAHSTQLGSDWEKFYLDKRSSATRRRDRSKRKHLSEFGEIKFITCAEPPDARRTLETLMEQKSRLLAHKGIADIFARPGWRQFFLDIASNPSTRAFVHVSRIQIGEVCAAANFGVVFGGTYYHLLTSYDDGALAQYGPGSLHLRELLAYAIGRRLQRFDFTIGDEPYKLEWSDSGLKLADYIQPVTLRGWPAYCQSLLRRRLKRFIKQTPWAWRVASRLRSHVGTLLRRPLPPSQQTASSRSPARAALACVMGDMDLVRPIALAGIRCAVVTEPGAPSLYSRYAQSRLPWKDFSANADTLVESLVRFGQAQRELPVLFYEEDAQLLLVSRCRDQLAQAFRFVITEASLVEDLVDKARFQGLAERHGLPVPPARHFHPVASEPDDLDLCFPVIIKPLTRTNRWNASFGLRKALAVESAAALHALWPQLVEVGVDLVAQELVPGAETQMETYHCYIDRTGGVAGEFTGRKIRTYPASFGHTTALEITDAADVLREGRAIAERLGLTGVAKLDFKRDPAGTLHLLEINPRFNLWHHAGALAGVNIPALVHADLTGTKRPQSSRARAGVRWCRAWKDFPAARNAGVPIAHWLGFTAGCEAKSGLSWDDPMPLPRAALHRSIRTFRPAR